MPLRNGGFIFYVDVWAFFNRPAVGLFALRNISQFVRGRTVCASTRVVILKLYHISIRGVEDAAPYHRARQNIKFIMCNKTKLQQDDASIVPYR